MAMYGIRACSVLSYKAQLMAIPSAILKTEKQLLVKLLRWPYTAAGKAELLAAHEVGGPRCPSLASATRAAALRFAATASIDAEALLQRLEAAAAGGVSLARWRRGQFWPGEWDSPAIVSEMSVARADALRRVGPARGRQCLQRELRCSLDAEAALPNWSALFLRRLSKLAPVLPLERRQSMVALFLGQVPEGGWDIARSWANAWTTSARFHHDEARGCIFGCGEGARDDLLHYKDCTPLGRHLAQFGCEANFLCAESATQFAAIAVASEVYHAIHYVKFYGERFSSLRAIATSTEQGGALAAP